MSGRVVGAVEIDLENARKIVHKHAPFVGGEVLLEDVAKAVADGIAFGRAEALTLDRSASAPTERANGPR
jgi:hypothetical protein